MISEPTLPAAGRLSAPAFLLGLFAFGVFGCGIGEPPAPEFRNLVVVMVDTLRSDHLPSYGYGRDTAPYLSRLSEEGIQLQGYSASSWTKSSIATLLTGLHPQRHQAISRSDSLPAEAPYLPELLSARGFSTAAYVGNKNVGKSFAFDRGFEAFYQFRPASKVDGEVVTERALSLADHLASRFFLYVHYVDPHDPYRPKKAWEDPEVADEAPVQPRHFQQRDGSVATEAQRRRMVAQYDGEIREVDHEIQTLLAGLRERGLLEDTLVVVTSDHGEEFQEHGGWTHGRTLFEEVLQVPLIFWSESPTLPPRQSSDAFHQVDFLPTVLDALGTSPEALGPPETLDGVSRWKAITGGQALETGPLYFHLDLDRRGALAQIKDSKKLIHTSREPFHQLYDLEADPREQEPTNGAGSELLSGLLRHHNRLGILAAQREHHTLDDETRKSLAALGYLQMDTPEEELAERTVPRKLDRERGLEALP